MVDSMTEVKSENEKLSKRIVVGKVISDAMQDTVIVMVERKVKHRKYGKYMKRSTKLYVHDEGNKHKKGTQVKVIETRPLSKLKRWTIVGTLDNAVV